MSPDPDYIRETRRLAARLEQEWLGKDPGTDSRYLPWMPFPISDFIALLDEANAEASGNRFLDIGAGIGSKMLLARELFGLRPAGLEISTTYAEQARALGLHVLPCDAADFTGYGEFDLIWFYRPFADVALQAALEKTVWDQMASGAIVIGAGLEAPPPEDRFFTHVDDWERKRGIWAKLPLKA